MDEYKGLKESSHLRHGVLILPVCHIFRCTNVIYNILTKT